MDISLAGNETNQKEPAPLVLVAGANGYIGKFVLSALTKKGYRTRALVRSAENADLIKSIPNELVIADATVEASLEEVCKDVHTVISCIGVKSKNRHPSK